MKLTLELTDKQWEDVSESIGVDDPDKEKAQATQEQVEQWLLRKLRQTVLQHKERAFHQEAAKSIAESGW
jgi:hypothetical protein